MSRQNRVDPWGQLQAVSAKGSWMGNRGIIHNEKEEIIAPWRHQNWVTCELKYKTIKRKLFSPGNYTELFFLDEVTALSAGHRPCGECRRKQYDQFKALWCEANIGVGAAKTPIAEIDRQLHRERAARGGIKVTFEAQLNALPAGTFISFYGSAFLLWGDRLYRWSPQGYTQDVPSISKDSAVTVLTPASIVKVLARGYKPQVHDSVAKEVLE